MKGFGSPIDSKTAVEMGIQIWIPNIPPIGTEKLKVEGFPTPIMLSPSPVRLR